MNHAQKATSAPDARESGHPAQEPLVLGFHGVRYQVQDVARAVEFYTSQLGFKLERQQLPALPTCRWTILPCS
ncbi:VOC family protein [Ramlibacter tataouinensis]|uniref:VOC family protein n=1 Tax=Ramlibacter tataouinensis TaxID=94132 RepID=UPI001D1305A5